MFMKVDTMRCWCFDW